MFDDDFNDIDVNWDYVKIISLLIIIVVIFVGACMFALKQITNNAYVLRLNSSYGLSILESRAYNICLKTDCNYKAYYELYTNKYNELKSNEGYLNYFDLFYDEFKEVDENARTVYSYPITMGDILFALNKTRIQDDVYDLYDTSLKIQTDIELYKPKNGHSGNNTKIPKNATIVTQEIVNFNATCKKPYPNLYFGKVLSLSEYRKIMYFFERCTK